MDTGTARMLVDLEGLLRKKIITLDEWMEAVAAVHNRVAAAESSRMRDGGETSVESERGGDNVSVSTCGLSESEKRAEVVEVEKSSGVGVGATKGKSEEVLEKDQHVASSKGKGGRNHRSPVMEELWDQVNTCSRTLSPNPNPQRHPQPESQSPIATSPT